VSSFELKASVTGAWGANHDEYRFGARAIERAMKVPHPAVLNAMTTTASNLTTCITLFYLASQIREPPRYLK
jgi:hypothetical protein